MPSPRQRMRIRNPDEFVLRRKALGSQRHVALLAGCKKSYLGELEVGDKPTCSRAIALGIARAFGLPVDEVFERVDQAVLPAGAADREVS